MPLLPPLKGGIVGGLGLRPRPRTSPRKRGSRVVGARELILSQMYEEES